MLSGNDFLLEQRLYKEDPKLHTLFTNSVYALQDILTNYKQWFPTFTDHSALHSCQVINFCNNIIGTEYIQKLNLDEIYILLMACYLHDSGMGISERDFYEFKDKIDLKGVDFSDENLDLADVIRRYHHEFAGQFIKKYAPFFEIPSEEHLFGIVQLARGHRKTDLMDVNEYPTALKLNNGNTVNLAYLAVLIRLADEIDIAIDRNPYELYQEYSKYSEASIKEFNMHKAIKHLDICEDKFVFYAEVEDEKIKNDVLDLMDKVRETLHYSLQVVRERSPYDIAQKYVEIIFE